ncbi:SMI1/KNR4 family protein [Pasteurella multocida]|uniref:SMI1/KNR4 family protein n=1 Tax=Pasteurella multocida TaxID=747 RepID=UPI0020255DB8|nr:SMI1/KNR4 family protein [Pasteurella multocida]MEB3451103.1 SMI1/KNR4 family protein [Pasteurella multocida]MEB3453862.1 SMI1/KNR4 family protein [Pasteurella multocida]MEB3456011.1 SMI1/KNR4 family protein [Pasteurella multocida]MEB3460402.1 SMI1/KNR4 family protein [Pasteurella multocida]MEB3462220.1 SMI1/KNR4 family protein [Pasteurella multocida]
MKFRDFGIYYDYGVVSQEIILDFEETFGIKLPKLYIELITKHNSPRLNRDHFNYYDFSTNEEEGTEFIFKGFETESNRHAPPENIYAQYLYDDEIYGYEHVYSFGSTACGDFICFDYRDNPKGSEPKICLVIHDEYDEETGKHLLFPVAENFEAFLDMLYDFDERYPNGYE